MLCYCLLCGTICCVCLNGGSAVDYLPISSALLMWYSTHFRSLPWRVEPSPYRVWISEIMLQQTRIEAALPYFERFISALPSVEALAAVSEEQLLKLWEGLGYYSRARNLKKTAQILVSDYEGRLPADYDRLLALPGIGPYTAGAIASIAYGIPVPAVDGNVMRVLSRLTGDETDVLSTAGKKCFTDLAWEMVPEQNPGRFNQAVMELGERVCIPNGAPHCDSCPLSSYCVSYKTCRTEELPVRAAKKARRIEKRCVAVIRIWSDEEQRYRLLLHKRGSAGLLAGLWELPNCLSNAVETPLPSFLSERGPSLEIGECKHIFSHVEWHMTGRLYTAAVADTLPRDYAAVTIEELTTAYALPSAFRYYAGLLPQLLKEGELNHG
ncbi:MAG: A/G-specific adenine glycosylase [Clostridia bacterium]|nr:A/G-specific adenine glycosylase [Clostridia bacterium]